MRLGGGFASLGRIGRAYVREQNCKVTDGIVIQSSRNFGQDQFVQKLLTSDVMWDSIRTVVVEASFMGCKVMRLLDQTYVIPLSDANSIPLKCACLRNLAQGSS